MRDGWRGGWCECWRGCWISWLKRHKLQENFSCCCPLFAVGAWDMGMTVWKQLRSQISSNQMDIISNEKWWLTWVLFRDLLTSTSVEFQPTQTEHFLLDLCWGFIRLHQQEFSIVHVVAITTCPTKGTCIGSSEAYFRCAIRARMVHVVQTRHVERYKTTRPRTKEGLNNHTSYLCKSWNNHE